MNLLQSLSVLHYWKKNWFLLRALTVFCKWSNRCMNHMFAHSYINLFYLCIQWLIHFNFLKYILFIMLLQLSHFFSPLLPSALHRPSFRIPPSQFMSMGYTWKFFGFSISHTILNLPLSILYLPLMLLIPCTFSHILFPPPPHWQPSMWSSFL